MTFISHRLEQIRRRAAELRAARGDCVDCVDIADVEPEKQKVDTEDIKTKNNNIIDIIEKVEPDPVTFCAESDRVPQHSTTTNSTNSTECPSGGFPAARGLNTNSASVPPSKDAFSDPERAAAMKKLGDARRMINNQAEGGAISSKHIQLSFTFIDQTAGV